MSIDNKEVKPAVKRRPPAAGMGRVKGSLNKTTRTAKEAIAMAAEGLGGADRMIAWAQEDPANERAFWASIYPKLIPVQISSDPDAPLQVQLIRRVVVDPK
jgi:hypothetical protein